MSNWIVAKFGGTSMGTTESMSRCAKIVADKNANIVIVSATSGTTNQLVELTDLVQKGDWEKCEQVIGLIRDRHLNMLAEAKGTDATKEKLEGFLRQLTTLVKGCCLLQECSPKAYDGIVSKGELMSSLIFFHILESELKNVSWLDSREVLSTDHKHNKARPIFEQIETNCRNYFKDSEVTYIGQGFIGAPRWINHNIRSWWQ